MSLRHTPPAGVRAGSKEKGKAAMARGIHPSPFRTGKLSPAAPMVLGDRESRTPPPYSGGQQATDAAVLHFFCQYALLSGSVLWPGREPDARATALPPCGAYARIGLSH